MLFQKMSLVEKLVSIFSSDLLIRIFFRMITSNFFSNDTKFFAQYTEIMQYSCTHRALKTPKTYILKLQ